jgi:hypothetical protein
MSRCFWNPVHSRNATDPPSEGDCANDATVLVGASGRWELCASCAALDVVVKAGLKQGPILTAEQRHARRMTISWREELQERIDIARENAPLFPSVLDAAKTLALLKIFEHLLNDPRAEKAIRRALVKR